MPSLVQKLAQRELINGVPSWLPESIQYEVTMGSEAYGVSSNNSDIDIYGFCIPEKTMVFPHLAGEIEGFGTKYERFGTWEQHHVLDPQARNNRGAEYDFQIHAMPKYFNLLMGCNPNIIDSLFVPARCIRYMTPIGERLRENRRIFLSKKAWHTYKGYSFKQIHKMRTKEHAEIAQRVRELESLLGLEHTTTLEQAEKLVAGKTAEEYLSLFRKGIDKTKRFQMVKEHGFDCHHEDTEFLTNRGWKRFEEVEESDKLAQFDVVTGELSFDYPIERVKKLYRGVLYEYKGQMSSFSVTPNHALCVSSATRAKSGYVLTESNWFKESLYKLREGYRSWFHIRRACQGRADSGGLEHIDDNVLTLSGLYLSDGTCRFRGGKVISARLSQVRDSKYRKYANSLISPLGLRTYTYGKETIWEIPRTSAAWLESQYGHGSRIKKLPSWVFQLSRSQVEIFLEALMSGDGTEAPNGRVYYTSSSELANSLHALLVSHGYVTTCRGPYKCETEYSSEELEMYQVYVSNSDRKVNCVDIKNRLHEVDYSGYVVCFEMPKGTLVTRYKGKPAFQGNTKFAYHVVRLLNEVEMIMTEGDLDIERNREQLKSIRRGEWTYEQICDYFNKKEKELETLYQSSTLRHSPDEQQIRNLLLDCLEMRFGNLSGVVERPDKADATIKQIVSILKTQRYI